MNAAAAHTCAAPAGPPAAGAAVTCPALLVAAPASGQGKTTVVAALARLLARQGARVRVFKCGPDFLDPFWHQLASGQAVHNIDLWMAGEADARARLHAAAQAADVVLVEGVMGLHDGSPSAARLARLLGLPVLAVVQAGRMAQTLGAVAHGLRTYRQDVEGPLPWAGVLANGVASDGHAALLRAAVAPAPLEGQGSDADPATGRDDGWLGHLPQNPAMHLPERHLGLVAAHELGHAEALARLDAAADLLAATPLGRLGLDGWRARWPVTFTPPPPAATHGTSALLAGRTVAVARDAAFAFIYPANVQALQALGARVVFFSPLAGDALPPCDALWLPGGYPELHAAALAARHDLRAQLHAHAQAGRPIWAECGGMMPLFEELTLADGHSHRLWGLLPGRVRMQKKLAGLGMQQWAAPGGTLRGHSFHYSTCQTPLAPAALTQPAEHSARRQGEPVYAHGSVRASYFHAWFASSLPATAQLFSSAAGADAATQATTEGGA